METTASSVEENSGEVTAKTFVFANEGNESAEILDSGNTVVDTSKSTEQPEAEKEASMVPGQVAEIIIRTAKPPLGVPSSESGEAVDEKTTEEVEKKILHRGDGDTGRVVITKARSKEESVETDRETSADSETENAEVSSNFDDNLKKVVAAASLSGAAVTAKIEEDGVERRVTIEETGKVNGRG